MKLIKLKAVLAAALVAGAGASAWAEDAPEEEVVAFGEAEFWLGGDEVAVASGEGEFWLGPDEIVEASAEKTFWLGPDGQPVGESAWLVQTDAGCYIVGEGKATALPNGFDRDSITSVEVEDGITEIGESFFKDCLFLNAVRVGKGVEKIGDKAFWFCMSLERIEIGNAAALDCLEKAVVYRAAFDSAGRPCVIPSISLPGYAEVLLGKRELTDEKWTELGPVGEKPMTEYGDYRFFKIELKAE